MKITIDDTTYPIEIVRKKSNKNTYFRVKEDGTLYVTTNFFVRDKEIEKMIQKNLKSIAVLYQKHFTKKANNEGFYYLGKRYEKVLVQGTDIILGENKVFVGKDADFDRWYRKQAKVLFQEHFDDCYANFTRKIPYPKLRIRKMTTRWGVCNHRDIVVTLNLELMKRDISCLDYVIYHELSHLVEANHSERFWKIVEENYPNYKNVRKKMKDY